MDTKNNLKRIISTIRVLNYLCTGQGFFEILLISTYFGTFVHPFGLIHSFQVTREKGSMPVISNKNDIFTYIKGD